MNILYHHRTLADGAEGIHIHEMVEAFRALGHRATVQGLARQRAPGHGDRGVLAAIRPRVPQVLFECAALGLNVAEYLRVKGQLRVENADILYTRHALLDVGALLAAKHRGVPVVLEVNTAYSAPQVRQFEPISLVRTVRREERSALRAATLVVAVSSPLAEYLRQLGGPRLRVLVLPNGANPTLFDPSRTAGSTVRSRYGLQERFVVGWAGVLRRWHGLEVLLDALAATPNAHLLLIGDGPDRARVEDLASERGLTGRLTVTGRVPHAEMPAHLAALDVAVAAGDRTGFASPMKLVEYMSMGLPILVPRQRNFEDLVQHDGTALFFRPADANDLAGLVRLLQSSPALRDRLGRAARLAVEQRHNWRSNAAAVVDAIKAKAEDPAA